MWNAEEVLKRPVGPFDYRDLDIAEVDERARALCRAVAKGADWKHLPGHILALFHKSQPHPAL